MRLLVCGGRNYTDQRRVDGILDNQDWQFSIELVIHGGARGADTCASRWAWKREIPQLIFPARWSAYRQGAGPIRNQQMIDEGHPTHVLAFPGGNGTRDMVQRAQRHNLPVWIVPP